MKMEQTKCSETSAYKIQTPGNYPEENIQHASNYSRNDAASCPRRLESLFTLARKASKLIGDCMFTLIITMEDTF